MVLRRGARARRRALVTAGARRRRPRSEGLRRASRGGTRLQFGHGRPACSGRFDVDNLRRCRDHVGHPSHGRLEVRRVHVRLAGGAVPEGFEQHELVGLFDASRPLKEDVARLCACGGREGGDTRESLVRDVGTDGELDDDEEHRGSLHLKRCFVVGAPLSEASRAGMARSRRGLRTALIEGDDPWRIVRA